MIYATAKRTSDGILSYAQASQAAPDESVIIQNAVNALGGVAGDWTYQELTEAQFNSVMAALPGRSTLSGGNITSSTAPSLTCDKTQIQNDGADTATFTCNVNDVTYVGAVKWRIGETVFTENAVAGIATLLLTSFTEGTIEVQVETVTHGVAFLSIEVV